MRRRGGYGRDFWQRFGVYRREVRERLARMDKPVWLHAVSVGEVIVARKLIAEWLRQRPAADVVLSTTTSTGHAVAQRDAPDSLVVIYNPLDLRGCVQRALDTIRPQRLILVEAEVWPNLVAEARRWGLPVTLANARLSPRSERRYRRHRCLVAPIFSLLDEVFVPEPDDRARWTAIGVRPEAIAVAGSVKHDYEAQSPDSRIVEFEQVLGNLWGHPLPPLLLAASTHGGEEAAIGRVYLALREKFPRLKYLVAPRHFERATEVSLALDQLGLRVGRRSRSPAPDIDTYLIDTTGELRAWQAIADVVVIGKSFLSTGGQNPVEALMGGRPVIFGPHMENFSALAAVLLERGGAIQVPDVAALETAVARLLDDPPAARTMVANARLALEPHQGAARRTISAILAASARANT
jgi:3-deoxy-D-manno-octulosonic-acid transferase